MSWNYRIVKKLYGKRDEEGKIVDPDSEYNEYYYGIHEVYYDHNGKVTMCTTDPINLTGETVNDLIASWACIAEAFKKSILNYDNIPEEGAYNEITESLKELQDENGNFRPTEELIAEGKLITHEVVMKDIRQHLNEIAEEKGEPIPFDPDYEFDMKEYRNEQAIEQKKSEDFFNKNFVGKSHGEVISGAIELFIEHFESENGE